MVDSPSAEMKEGRSGKNVNEGRVERARGHMFPAEHEDRNRRGREKFTERKRTREILEQNVFGA